MDKYPLLTDREIKQTLNEAAEKDTFWGGTSTQTKKALKSISRAIASFQSYGLNIQLKSLSYANDYSFKFENANTIEATGIIKLYDTELMFAVSRSSKKNDKFSLLLSTHDWRYNKKSEARNHTYDLTEDLEESLRAFQQRLLYDYAALTDRIKFDISDVLEWKHSGQPKKPSQIINPAHTMR